MGSMAVDNDVLYWIEEFGSNLLWVKDSRDDVSWQDLESVTGMFNKLHVATFFLNPENKKSSCHSASCSHFCFNKDSSGHVCKCPYGMNLDPSDDSSCVQRAKMMRMCSTVERENVFPRVGFVMEPQTVMMNQMRPNVMLTGRGKDYYRLFYLCLQLLLLPLLLLPLPYQPQRKKPHH